MIRHFYFMRPIQHVEEGEMPSAIIVWYKRPHEKKVFTDGDVRRDYTSKYEYGVNLDLWFVKTIFRWVGREQGQPK